VLAEGKPGRSRHVVRGLAPHPHGGEPPWPPRVVRWSCSGGGVGGDLSCSVRLCGIQRLIQRIRRDASRLVSVLEARATITTAASMLVRASAMMAKTQIRALGTSSVGIVSSLPLPTTSVHQRRANQRRRRLQIRSGHPLGFTLTPGCSRSLPRWEVEACTHIEATCSCRRSCPLDLPSRRAQS